MPYKINIIGAGKLGKTLGRALVQQGIAKIGAVQNRSKNSAFKAIQFIGEGHFYEKASEIPAADFTFITTSDGQIEAAFHNYQPYFQKGSVVAHCSGAYEASLLQSDDFYVASVHPIASFAKQHLKSQTLKGIPCSIEGDHDAVLRLKTLFQSLEAIPLDITGAQKKLYHTASVISSNYLITLASHALSTLEKAAIETKTAMLMIKSCMATTLANLDSVAQPRKALTGPIQRGDFQTLKAHLEALSPYSKEKELYKQLARATIDLSEHDEQVKEKLHLLFE